MQIHLKNKTTAISLLLWCIVWPGIASGQEPKSLVASANGTGTIKLGKEVFKIHAVVVKLFEDGKAELNVITDITVFVSGTWSRGDDAERAIDLKIAGGLMSAEGTGKLFLSEDRKSIVRLKMEVVNKTTRKVVTFDFIAK